MLLRSSSTPILGSLLSSFSSYPHFNENPNNNNNHIISLEKSSSSPSLSSSSLLRTQSDGNLHSLLSLHTPTNPALESIPSFSVYNSRDQEDGDEEEDQDQFDEDGKGANVIGRDISGAFSFLGQNQNLNLVSNFGDNGDPTGPLFLARGLGIDRLGSGLLSAGGNSGRGSGGVRSDIEMYYKRMVEENPSNGLFLSNYAQFLYKMKGDAQRAEEYYSRAILAEPGDGEILSQYAKLVWELHCDEERASSYFEQAVQATPNDSHVLAAYANFLWAIEDNDGDNIGEDGTSQDYLESTICHEIVAHS